MPFPGQKEQRNSGLTPDEVEANNDAENSFRQKISRALGAGRNLVEQVDATGVSTEVLKKIQKELMLDLGNFSEIRSTETGCFLIIYRDRVDFAATMTLDAKPDWPPSHILSSTEKVDQIFRLFAAGLHSEVSLNMPIVWKNLQREQVLRIFSVLNTPGIEIDIRGTSELPLLVLRQTEVSLHTQISRFLRSDLSEKRCGVPFAWKGYTPDQLRNAALDIMRTKFLERQLETPNEQLKLTVEKDLICIKRTKKSDYLVG